MQITQKKRKTLTSAEHRQFELEILHAVDPNVPRTAQEIFDNLPEESVARTLTMQDCTLYLRACGICGRLTRTQTEKGSPGTYLLNPAGELFQKQNAPPRPPHTQQKKKRFMFF